MTSEVFSRIDCSKAVTICLAKARLNTNEGKVFDVDEVSIELSLLSTSAPQAAAEARSDGTESQVHQCRHLSVATSWVLLSQWWSSRSAIRALCFRCRTASLAGSPLSFPCSVLPAVPALGSCSRARRW